MAVVELQLHKLAKVNVTGIWSFGRHSKSAYQDNDLIDETHFLSGDKAKMVWNYHPAFNLRKIKQSVDSMSGVAPFQSTITKKSGESSFKPSEMIGRKDEQLLIVKIYESYFESFNQLTSQDLDLSVCFDILRGTDRYRPVFPLEYGLVIKSATYKALTADIIRMSKQSMSVKKINNAV